MLYGVEEQHARLASRRRYYPHTGAVRQCTMWSNTNQFQYHSYLTVCHTDYKLSFACNGRLHG